MERSAVLFTYFRYYGKKKCVKLLTVSKLITILKAKIRYISVLPKKKKTTATIIHFDFCVEN